MTVSNIPTSPDRKSKFHEQALMWSKFHMGGTMKIQVLGCAPHPKLRNIHGFNWPSPPMDIDHVTYCYLSDTQSADIQKLADNHEARFHNLEVRLDDDRAARLIYHGDGAHVHLHGNVDCHLVVEDVQQGKYKGTRWLHLVHSPGMSGIPPKPKVKKEAEESDGVADVANAIEGINLSRGVAPSFSQSM